MGILQAGRHTIQFGNGAGIERREVQAAITEDKKEGNIKGELLARSEIGLMSRRRRHESLFIEGKSERASLMVFAAAAFLFFNNCRIASRDP